MSKYSYTRTDFKIATNLDPGYKTIKGYFVKGTPLDDVLTLVVHKRFPTNDLEQYWCVSEWETGRVICPNFSLAYLYSDTRDAAVEYALRDIMGLSEEVIYEKLSQYDRLNTTTGANLS